MLAQNFHRPLVEIVGFWHNGCTRVALKKKVVDAIIREKGRQSQATTSTTDDDDRDVNNVRHRRDTDASENNQI